MNATEHELVKTTPAGASLVAFARLCNDGIDEFCRNGKISQQTMSLMVDARQRLLESEEAARVINRALLRTINEFPGGIDNIEYRWVKGMPIPFIRQAVPA